MLDHAGDLTQEAPGCNQATEAGWENTYLVPAEVIAPAKGVWSGKGMQFIRWSKDFAH